jgi:hypothetical protein
VCVHVARMRLAALADEGQDGLGATASRGCPAGRIDARVHERVDASRHEAVVDEEVLFDAKRGEPRFEVASAIARDAMAECQVLRTRRRADRIGLYEPEALEGLRDASWTEERARDRVASKVVETEAHGFPLLPRHQSIGFPLIANLSSVHGQTWQPGQPAQAWASVTAIH